MVLNAQTPSEKLKVIKVSKKEEAYIKVYFIDLET